MRQFSRFILLFTMGLGFAAILTSPVLAQAADRPIALVGGMLLDGYEAPGIANSVVIIEGDKIVAVGTVHDTPVPENAHIIDTRGKTVMPGLTDLHMHLEMIGHGDYREFFDFIELEGRDSMEDVRAIAGKHLLRSGVTTAVDLGATLDILETRRRFADGEIPGPHLLTSGPLITRMPATVVPDGMHAVISSPQEAAEAVNRQIDAGVDVIKAWVGLTAEDYIAIVDAAHSRNVKVHAHLYSPESIEMALDAGVDVLQHVGSGRNPAYPEDLILRIANANIPVVQTIAHRIWIYPASMQFPARLQDWRLRADLSEDLYEEFQRSFEYFHRRDYFRAVERESRLSKIAARQFIDADAVMGVGTDGGSPLNFHFESMWREMSALVDSGMSPIQVISAATKTNAEILGNMEMLGGTRNFGTIETGMRADILVIDGDPLFNINALGYIDLVIKAGTPWYDESKVTDVLREIGREF